MKLALILPLILACALFLQPVEARWTPCGPADAFSIASVVVNPANPATVYATGETSPMEGGAAAWKTTDGGKTWSRVVLGGGGGAVFEVHRDAVYELSQGRVFRSTDAAAHWTELGRVTASSSHLWALTLAVDPSSPDLIFVGLGYQGREPDGGVMKSTDGGATWTPSGLTGSTVYTLRFAPDETGALYAAGSSGLHRTTDGGRTWTAVGPGGVPARHMTVAIDPRDPGRIFVGTSGSRGIYLTTDGGATWVASNKGLTDPAVYAMAIDPERSSIVWAGTSGGGVFLSTDGGESWSSMIEGSRAQHTKSVSIAPGPPAVVYFSAGRSGILRWDDD